MPAILVQIFGAMLGSALARILLGAGLAVATFTVVDSFVQDALAALNQFSSGLPSDLIKLIALSGIGTVMTGIGTALALRAAIVAAQTTVTKG